MSEEIKKIVENAKSEDEFLKNLDKVGHRLSDEELEAVTGGDLDSDAKNYWLSICGESDVRTVEFGVRIQSGSNA